MRRRHLLAGSLATLLTASEAWCEAVGPTPPTGPASSNKALTPVQKLAQIGLYLPVVKAMRGDDPGGGQLLAQYLAMIGDERGAFTAWAKAGTEDPATTAPPPSLADARAEGAIVRASRGRRLVILNEAHHVSRCRAFAAQVALRLRAEGFSILAAETFSNSKTRNGAQSLNAGKPVTTGGDFYAKDPVYAEFVRAARVAGYHFEAYEKRFDLEKELAGHVTVDPKLRVAEREEAEAENLISDVLTPNPNARVFVYCGFGHVVKQPYKGQAMFAARVKAKTGIDPLCITQSAGSPSPDPTQDAPLLRAVLDHFSPAMPIVAMHADGRHSERGSTVWG